jgi:predicted RNA-binding protein YlxR (DUF448 family)
MGCGERENQDLLIRVALTEDGRLIVDRLVGRGGYLHRTAQCWRQFSRRKGQHRTFRAEVTRAAREQLVKELMDRYWE